MIFIEKRRYLPPTVALGVFIICCVAPNVSPAAPTLEQQELFEAGQSGYNTFRIPAVIVSSEGTVLAFAEGRVAHGGDAGDIDIVLRRSEDGGKTWGPIETIAEDGANTVGNPCPVIDRETGTIWLLLTWNLGSDHESAIMRRTSKETRRVWVTKSTDDGKSWEKPIDITQTAKKPNWTWYATGPGVGIQLRSGRLVIPCDHAVAVDGDVTPLAYHSHVIYSDDRGATWKIGGVAQDRTNECQVIEREDGSLLLNMRSYHGLNQRAVAESDDGGSTWSETRMDAVLIEPVCQASILRFSSEATDGKSRVLFSNPASEKREKMTVRLSYDDGQTWPIAKELYGGSSAYSCLTVLPGNSIGCLYERDDYKKITLARFSLEWLSGGNDSVH